MHCDRCAQLYLELCGSRAKRVDEREREAEVGFDCNEVKRVKAASGAYEPPPVMELEEAGNQPVGAGVVEVWAGVGREGEVAEDREEARTGTDEYLAIT